MKEFARSYARAVAGIPLKMDFVPRTGRFDLVGFQFSGSLSLIAFRVFRDFEQFWSLNPTIAQPTEVFLPALQYPRGFVVDGTANIEWTTPAPNLLHVRAKPGAQKGDLARVSVTPKP